MKEVYYTVYCYGALDYGIIKTHQVGDEEEDVFDTFTEAKEFLLESLRYRKEDYQIAINKVKSWKKSGTRFEG